MQTVTLLVSNYSNNRDSDIPCQMKTHFRHSMSNEFHLEKSAVQATLSICLAYGDFTKIDSKAYDRIAVLKKIVWNRLKASGKILEWIPHKLSRNQPGKSHENARPNFAKRTPQTKKNLC